MTGKRFYSRIGKLWAQSLILLASILLTSIMAACNQAPGPLIPISGASVTPVPTGPASACADPFKVVDAFYAANNAARFDESVTYLTDDISLVTWAEGVNGRHMMANFAVGRDQIRDFLGKPGMITVPAGPNLPAYTRTEVTQSPNQVFFKLEADRKHPDGRPYNPYWVKMIFSGCKIEIIKLVERVVWL